MKHPNEVFEKKVPDSLTLSFLNQNGSKLQPSPIELDGTPSWDKHLKNGKNTSQNADS